MKNENEKRFQTRTIRKRKTISDLARPKHLNSLVLGVPTLQRVLQNYKALTLASPNFKKLISTGQTTFSVVWRDDAVVQRHVWRGIEMYNTPKEK